MLVSARSTDFRQRVFNRFSPPQKSVLFRKRRLHHLSNALFSFFYRQRRHPTYAFERGVKNSHTPRAYALDSVTKYQKSSVTAVIHFLTGRRHLKQISQKAHLISFSGLDWRGLIWRFTSRKNPMEPRCQAHFGRVVTIPRTPKSPRELILICESDASCHMAACRFRAGARWYFFTAYNCRGRSWYVRAYGLASAKYMAC